MDPTTTLITFMLRTTLSIHSVQLLGSWDNFSQRYPMERDLRRGKDQWRGCYTFKDIICDGDGARSPKRNGGLKMGQEYWYYYELNDETEVHDPTVPSTTSCPYLPGQQVNSLWVPLEVSPLRERSASTGTMSGDFKTMNPDDKFLTPRAPPSIPKGRLRLNTSPALLERKRSTRSVSPKGKSPWSARALFGLMSPTSAQPEGSRGRLFSPTEREFPKAPAQFPLTPVDRPYTSRPSTAMSRGTSPESQRKLRSQSREQSPLRVAVIPENSTLIIPDEIAEEEFEDDDANFATVAEASATCLSPPPQSKQLAHLRTAISDMKPLPMLPAQSPDLDASLVPSPLRPRGASGGFGMPRSHFSIDTISTGFISPTSPSYSDTDEGVGSPPSICDFDSFDEDDGTMDSELSFSGRRSLNPEGGHSGWTGYSLPDGMDAGSELTLGRKSSTELVGGQVGVRTTFGPGAGFGAIETAPRAGTGVGEEVGTALDQLLQEMGYLGGAIIGK